MAKKYIGTYKVYRVYRKSGRRTNIETGLTNEQAMRLAQSFPNSQTSMVCKDKQFWADKYFIDVPDYRYFAHLNPSKGFIQKIYRVKHDDTLPYYYGEQGGWHASESFGHIDSLISSTFFNELTEEDVKQYLK